MDEHPGTQGKKEKPAARKKDAGMINFTVKPLDLQLAGSFENKEAKNHLIDDVYSIKLKGSPIIGATIEVDILTALLNMVTGGIGGTAAKGVDQFASFMKAIMERMKGKQKSSKNFKAQVSMMLTVAGSIDSDLHWQKKINAVATGTDIGNSNAAKVEFKIEGKVLFEATAFKVICGAGAAVALGGADGASPCSIEGKLVPAVIDGKPGIDGAIEFNGMAISYMSFVRVSLDNAVNKDEVSNRRQVSDEPGDEVVSEEKIEFKEDSTNTFVIMKPKKWPEKALELASNEET